MYTISGESSECFTNVSQPSATKTPKGPCAIIRAVARTAGDHTGDTEKWVFPSHDVAALGSKRPHNCWRDLDPERLRRFDIDYQFEFEGCSIGKSAGFAPLRILSTKVAALVCISA
jgi:hypothetical protein